MTLREISAQMHPFEVLEESLSALPLPMEPAPFDMPEIIMYSDRPSKDQVLEMHDEVSAEEPNDLEIVVEDLPGVEALDPEMEKTLEVSDDAMSSNETLRAEDDEKSKPKVKDKWDLMANGPKGFFLAIQERIENVPSHSGYDISGCERALASLNRLADEVSKTMRNDIDGLLDANKVEEALSKIDDGRDRLFDRIEKIKSSKKSSRRKKKADVDAGLVKEGQKSMPMGMVITVPLLISRIARVIINGMVSAGKDAEDLFQRQAEYYNLDRREKAELQQLLADMGMAIRQDRGAPENEDIDSTSENNFDWIPSYSA